MSIVQFKVFPGQPENYTLLSGNSHSTCVLRRSPVCACWRFCVWTRGRRRHYGILRGWATALQVHYRCWRRPRVCRHQKETLVSKIFFSSLSRLCFIALLPATCDHCQCVPSAPASSHAITSDISVLETMKAAEFFQSDGVILTGGATGLPPSVGELQGALLRWSILHTCTKAQQAALFMYTVG